MSRCKGLTKRGTGCRNKSLNGNKGMCRMHGETVLKSASTVYIAEDDGYVSSQDEDYLPGDTLSSSDDDNAFDMTSSVLEVIDDNNTSEAMESTAEDIEQEEKTSREIAIQEEAEDIYSEDITQENNTIDNITGDNKKLIEASKELIRAAEELVRM